MTSYTVSPGSEIRFPGGQITGGMPVPEHILKAWGEAGIRANLEAGTIQPIAEGPSVSKKDKKA